MSAITFPASPYLNQVFASGTSAWQWDGVAWRVIRETNLNTQIGFEKINFNGASLQDATFENGSLITKPNFELGATGILPVLNGGTGTSVLTAENVLVGNGNAGVKSVAPGTFGNVLTSNGASWESSALRVKTWTAFTASGSYTVPSGVNSIRAYSFGKGGNASSTTGYAGGGGGGCAYGDITVTAGQVVTVTISAGVATVSYGGTTLLTANPGSNGVGATGGSGGSATKHASVTNGGAYSGGAGGAALSSGCSGGGSAGSPLGNGYNGGNTTTSSGASGGGGAGGAGGGSTYYASGGGGAGGAGGINSGGGGGGAGGAGTDGPGGLGGIGRYVENSFSDPLLAGCTSPGGNGSYAAVGATTNGSTSSAENGGPGAGGGGAFFGSSSSGQTTRGGAGGAFGGGGGARSEVGSSYGGNGGFGGGGGGALGSTSGFGGNGGYGGGGGGGSTTSGTGGPAIVLIYA